MTNEQDYLSAIIDTAGALIVVLDRQGRIVRFNNYCEEITGYSFSEVRRVAFWDIFLLPEEIEGVKKVFAELASGQFPNRHTNYWLTKSGEKRLIEWNNTSLLTDEGQVDYVIAIGIDVTDKQKAEQALRNSEQRYSQLFSDNHAPMLLIDPETGAIVDANPAACTYYGYLHSEIIQKKITDINTLPPEQVKSEMERAREKRKDHFSFSHRLANGEIRAVEVYTSPMDTGGKTLLFSIIHDVTERKKAEEEVKSISKFPDENPSPVMRISRDGLLIFANPASAPILEIWNQQIGTKSPPDMLLHIQKVMESGFSQEIEIRCYDRIYSLILAPIQQDGYVNVYGRDVTEKRNAEIALRTSDARLRIALAHAGFTVFSQDRDLNYTWVYNSVSNGQRASGPSEPVLEIFPGDNTEEIIEIKAKVLETGMGSRQEIRLGAGEKYKVYDLIIEPIWNEDGLVNGILGSALDITERKQIEEDRKRRADELDAIINSMTEAVIIYNADGELMRLNPAAIDAYGYDPIGEDRLEVAQRLSVQCPDGCPIDPADLPSSRALTGEVVRSQRLLLTNARGEQLVILVSGSPIRLGGELVGAVVVFHDITDRERAQKALKKYAQQLERTNRDLQDFAFISSHDLQEPLRKIQAFSERIATKYADALDTTGIDYLSRMNSAAARMQNMINDLLAYSRVTSQTHNFVKVSLAEVVDQVLSDYEMRIEESQAFIEVSKLPTIKADPFQMHHLFMNLVSNSLKFQNKATAPVVKIKWSNPEEILTPEKSVEIVFEDNGIGFDEKYIKRIFQPFQRLHSHRAFEGSGIGLAICRKIVEFHGGSITASSTPGQGSIFVVRLPVEQIT
jgi:two-component system, LuxR family, sensor kinase FixL